MQFDFDQHGFDNSYAKRVAHADWMKAVIQWVDPAGKTVADIGCGGGIYARAFVEMGAHKVIGVEPSAQMRRNAQAYLHDLEKGEIVEGRAEETGLPSASVDIVFSRAVVHHLDDAVPFLEEARRILVRGGVLIIQDRTLEDVTQPASKTHLRGLFFEHFPKLLELERKRRPKAVELAASLKGVGFGNVSFEHAWETRRTYDNREALRADLHARTGRSILHALSEAQLVQLVDWVLERTPENHITERDRWTFWIGENTG